ncbi:MAG: hypothetical protein WBW61_08690, partial [Rhodanobacteraceae bacterium]
LALGGRDPSRPPFGSSPPAAAMLGTAYGSKIKSRLDAAAVTLLLTLVPWWRRVADEKARRVGARDRE